MENTTAVIKLREYIRKRKLVEPTYSLTKCAAEIKISKQHLSNMLNIFPDKRPTIECAYRIESLTRRHRVPGSEIVKIKDWVVGDKDEKQI